eukprot:TRINITY_DN3513_c0_g2_i2.p1 TRINITY_DN3513_c0_g2~~TRINITY_DN3513_c0_g2_i2.p1  ORF type:complete len:283 (-),score=28.44 TRINITY_DN3513_c0_g2_i2:258-980(-)
MSDTAISVSVLGVDGRVILPAFELEPTHRLGMLRSAVAQSLGINDDKHRCRLFCGERVLDEDSDVEVADLGFAEQATITTVVEEVPPIIVKLTEEYCYREWLWHTGMSSSALEKYWFWLSTLEEFFLDPRKLPGVLVPRFDKENGAVMGFLPETLSWNQGDVDEKLCPGFENASGEEVVYPNISADWWSGHLHRDDDSYLLTPQGKRVTHGQWKPMEKVAARWREWKSSRMAKQTSSASS